MKQKLKHNESAINKKNTKIYKLTEELEGHILVIQQSSSKIFTHVGTNTTVLTTADFSINTLPANCADASVNTLPANCADASVNTSPVKCSNISVNTSPVKNKQQKDAISNTIHSFLQTCMVDKSLATSPLHISSVATSPIHQIVASNEKERMRNVLLAELMSLQLLYSMFDLTLSSQIDMEKTGSSHTQTNDDTASDCKDNDTPALSTPSGYETGSHSQLEIDRPISTEKSNSINRSRNVTPDYFRFPTSQSSFHDSPMLAKLQETYTPKTGGLLEEIIEAQLSGSFAGSGSVTLLPIEDRISFLRREIGTHKKSIDEEIITLAGNLLEEESFPDDGKGLLFTILLT